MISRRAVLAGGAVLLAGSAGAQDLSAHHALRALEQETGARIGVAALDTGNARAVYNRQNQRFIMCSTFKLSLAAAILKRVDAGAESLDRVIHYGTDELLMVSPATTRNQRTGMRIADLCEAAVIYSDNTAANLLLSAIGGPGSLTLFWRGLGDQVSRLDDVEPKLNLPDGERNTTAPDAMLGSLQKMLLGDALSQDSRMRLLGWMAGNTTGGAMLRAGLPANWHVGDKTGRWIGKTTDRGATNDLAIVTPPGRKPILIAVYTMGGSAAPDARPAMVAHVGRILAQAFA